MGAQSALVAEGGNIVFKTVIVAKRSSVLSGGGGRCKRSQQPREAGRAGGRRGLWLLLHGLEHTPWKARDHEGFSTPLSGCVPNRETLWVFPRLNNRREPRSKTPSPHAQNTST